MSNISKRDVWCFFLYLIPYLTIAEIVSDLTIPFIEGIKHVLIIFGTPVVYIGLGFLCGKQRRACLCMVGTIIHCVMYRMGIVLSAWLFPELARFDAEKIVLFPFVVIVIVLSQLFGYWCGRPFGIEKS